MSPGPTTSVDDVEASLVLHLPQREVYDSLFDFTQYRHYTDYLEDARIRGEGVGTRFGLTFSWWRLSYTLRSRVTDVDPPERIEWRVTKDVDARGHWAIEPAPDEVPPDGETATRARLYVEFDRSSVESGALDTLAPTDWVLSKVLPLVEPEAERAARRAVADLEGDPRPVDVEIHSRPDTI